MQKRLLSVLLMGLSCNAVAGQTYLAVGAGVSHVSHDEVFAFSNVTVLPNRTVILTPRGNDPAWNALVGYRFSHPEYSRLGVEFGYTYFAIDKEIDAVTAEDTASITTGYWDSDFKAHRIVIKPVYFHDFNAKASAKLGFGLTYTDYKITGNSFQTTQDLATGAETQSAISGEINPENVNKKALGATASVGLDYLISESFTIGAEANVTFDAFASTAQLLGTVGYRF